MVCMLHAAILDQMLELSQCWAMERIIAIHTGGFYESDT